MPLWRSACSLDPVKFRATFKRDATGKFDKETLCEVNKCIMGVLHLVDSVFARQCSSTTGSSQQDEDNITGLIANEMDGWGAKKLHGKLQEYRKTDKSDATDPLDWWRAHAKGLEPLDMVARWLLCIPATSVESERTFSLAGRLVSPLRLDLLATECTNSRCSPVSCGAVPLGPIRIAHLHDLGYHHLGRVHLIGRTEMTTGSHC